VSHLTIAEAQAAYISLAANLLVRPSLLCIAAPSHVALRTLPN
jgi:hypothetical protein